jgi:adenylate cyclase
MNSRNFVAELKRRKVLRVAIAYVIGGWALAQGIAQVLPVFEIANWIVRLIVLLIVLGFPVALVLSWFFDLTRSGIIRTPDAEPVGWSNFVQTTPPLEKSIAVLPFSDLSPGSEHDYFGDGVAGEIITALAKVKGLRVAARRSSFWFKGKEAELSTIARRLNVAHVLEGTVRREGNRIRITAELIDVSKGSTTWSETFDREFAGIFVLQDEITRATVEALKLKLDIPVAVPPTHNAKAYDLYLRARALGSYSDERSLEQTIALLRQALMEDPHFAAAWGDLARAYLSIVDAYRAPLEILAPAQHAALMAVAHDEAAAAGHIFFGAISLIFTWDFPVAKRELAHAVMLDPDSSDARRWHAWYLARVEKDFDSARAELERARILDPLSPWPVWAASTVAIAHGDYEAAMQSAEHLLEIDPHFFYDEDPIAHVYVAMGRWHEGIKRYESLAVSVLGKPNFELAVCYAGAGDTTRAREILNRLEVRAQHRYVDRTHIAAIYAALGDTDQAFAELDRAFQDRSARISAPRFYPWLAPLLDDPRLATLEYKVNHSPIAIPAESARPLAWQETASEKSIAVLPFENLSEDETNRYFVSGIQTEILTKLARVGQLKVISKRSTEKYQSHPEDLQTVSRQLGVGTVLEGSVQKTGDQVLIHVHLINAETGNHLWAQSYKRPLKNLLDVETEVAERVAKSLQVKLIPAEAQQPLVPDTTRPRARDLYLRAHALTAHSDEPNLEQAAALLRQAVEEDPNYAVAWAELSGVYIAIADVYRAPLELLGSSRHAALMAIASDSKLSVGHTCLGCIELLYDWNFPLAKRELERAVQLGPNSADAHRWYGFYLARVERDFIAGRSQLEQSRSLDPLYPWPLWILSNVAIAQGDYDWALRFAERILEVDPNFFYDEDPIAHAYAAMGRWQDALKRYESLPTSVLAKPNFELAICYAHVGETARAKGILADLEEFAQCRYVDQSHIAAIYAALGDRDKAFFALDRACDDRSARISALRFYPWLAPLLGDRRLAALEDRIAHSAIVLPGDAGTKR